MKIQLPGVILILMILVQLISHSSQKPKRKKEITSKGKIINSCEGYVWECSGEFEGDILLDKFRNGIGYRIKRWEYGIVPYVLDKSYLLEEKQKIISTLRILEQKTASCIRFVPRTNESDYALIHGKKLKCSSIVGRTGGEQEVQLHRNCLQYKTMAHELLHLLGFYHMQNNYNRNEYVEIIWENINEDAKANFERYGMSLVTDFGFPYDYWSIMHYSNVSQSKNKKPTVEPLKKGVVLGKAEDLSQTDLLKLKKFYECK